MNLKKYFGLLFCLFVLMPSQTRTMDKDLILRSFYAAKVVCVIGAVIIGGTQVMNFMKVVNKTSRNDKVVELNSLKEMLLYVWKLITGKVVHGSGAKEQRVMDILDINSVTKISIKNLCLRIICDPTIQNNMFTVEGDGNIIPLINYKVDQGSLHIDTNNFFLYPKCDFVCICTLKKVDEITLSGKSKLDRLSQLCSENIGEHYDNNSQLVSDLKSRGDDLTINLLDNAYMRAGTGSGEPTIHRNITANVSGNSRFCIGGCNEIKLNASGNVYCYVSSRSLLEVLVSDNAYLNVGGGCKLTGVMHGNSKLSTSRRKDDYFKIDIQFSNKNEQWVDSVYWE